MAQMDDILSAIATVRCGASASEEELHRQVIEALERAGLPARHEAVLGPRCRIDLLCGGVGIEIKKSRPIASALIRQLTRYAACEQVEALLVLAPRAVNLPRRIGGKPVVMVGLERLWGISLP